MPEAIYREVEEGKDKYYLDLSKFNWVKVIKITGTIGILLKAKKLGIIKKVKPL